MNPSTTHSQRVSLASSSSAASSNGAASFRTALADPSSSPTFAPSSSQHSSQNNLTVENPSSPLNNHHFTPQVSSPSSSPSVSKSPPTPTAAMNPMDAVDVQIVKVSADLSHPVFARALSDSPKQQSTSLPFPNAAFTSEDLPQSLARSSSLDAARAPNISTSTLPNPAPRHASPEYSAPNVSPSIKRSLPAGPTVVVPPENLLHPPPSASSASSVIAGSTSANAAGSASTSLPHRRNTTGSAPRPITLSSAASVPTRSRISLHSQFASSGYGHGHGYVAGSGADEELMSDISVHAEIIRKERLERRQLQAEKEKEKGKESRQRNVSMKGEPKVLVGNLIGEGHVNYVLMYNMLTGIRTSVSRCQAKMKRPLTSDDFKASHKYTFDIIGNELTPSAKYDFKFKDYAPWVFRELRESYFRLDPADYLVSLTGQYILSELGSPGKSGSFFYFSKDYRFIIKTIHPAEHKFLLKVLPQYHAHIQANPNTLISRFYGLHRVKLPRGSKIHFVIMNNLFPPHKDIHETFDLKGSTVGRLYPWDKAREKGMSSVVMKDLNWIELGRRIELGPEKRSLLTEQLRRDKEFLKTIKVMDYSLLIGVHNMQRGNRDKVRKNTLKVFSPDLSKATMRRSTPPTASASPHPASPQQQQSHQHSSSVSSSVPQPQLSAISPPASPMAPTNFSQQQQYDQPQLTSSPSTATEIFSVDVHTVRQAVQQAPNPQRLGRHTVRLPKGMSGDSSHSDEHKRRAEANTLLDGPVGATPGGSGADARTHFLFYHDEGGLRGTDESDLAMDVVYYLGVIDILTPWNTRKRAEGLYKGIRDDRRKISPIRPDQYADRFFDFMKAVMRGGEGGGRFV